MSSARINGPDATSPTLQPRSHSIPLATWASSPPHAASPPYSTQHSATQPSPAFSPPPYSMPPLRAVQSNTVPSSPPMYRQAAFPGPPVPPAQAQSTQKKQGRFTRGAKKAYAITQKNTLTKVGTRVALTAVGVAIGADIAGLVDGLGAMDFGGIGDGSSFGAPDMSGLDAAGGGDQSFGDTGVQSGSGQDFSNLPNGAPETTAWMQQQYFQNVTLPNLAGPSMTPAQMYVG